MAKHKRARTPPQYVQRQKTRRRKNPLSTRLRSRYRGEWCATVKTKTGAPKLCVTGRQYGFEAWLMSSTGQKFAPVSVSARTPKDALRQAAATVRRLSGGGQLGPVKRVR